MKITLRNCGILALLLRFAPASLGADEAITLLETRTATYTNVTVTRRNETNIYFSHDGGVASIKIEDLPPDAQKSLGYATEEAASKASRILHRVEKSSPFKMVRSADGVNVQAGVYEIHLNSADIKTIALGAAMGYMIFCICGLLLCKKTENEPGLLIWIPILQAFPLLRAAGMSGWWFLAFFIPVLNLVAWWGWCVNIVIARGKSLLWAPLLILPVTNVFAFVYLAMAKADSPGEGSRTVRIARSAVLRAPVIK